MMEYPVYYGVVRFCNNLDGCTDESVLPIGFIPDIYFQNVKQKVDVLLFNHFVGWIRGDSFKFEICLYDNLTVDQKAELNRVNQSEAWLELLKEISEIVESYVTLYRQEQVRRERTTRMGLIPVTSNTNLPAVQGVQRDIIWQDTRPAIYAEGGEAINRDELAEITAGNTTQLLSQNNGIRKTVNGIDKKVDGMDKKVDEALTLLQNIQGQTPFISEKDKEYLSITNTDVRRARMSQDGMKPEMIKKWEIAHDISSTNNHSISSSIDRGKNSLGIPKKTRKQDNSKPKK